MNIQIQGHPEHLSLSGTTKIKYDITIIDSGNQYVIFKESNSRTLDDLNSVLSQLDDPKSGNYEVSISIDYYNSSKRTFIPCMDISRTSELLKLYNNGIAAGNWETSYGSQEFQKSIYDTLNIYLIEETRVKDLTNWASEKYKVDVESLTNKILELEATVSLAKQEITSKKKLAAEVVYSQNNISELENQLSKVDTRPLQDLYNGYTLLSTSTIDGELRKRYNAFMSLVKQWNVLADQLGLNFIK